MTETNGKADWQVVVQSLPAGVVFSATNISCGTESEALAQQQALLPKQQHTLCHSEAAHHHNAHFSLNLQKDERERDAQRFRGRLHTCRHNSLETQHGSDRHSRLELIDHFNQIS